jgi:hypothetical protein
MKLQDLKDLCLIDRDPLVLEDTGMEGMFIVGADGDVIETVYAKRDSFQYNTILLMIHRNNMFENLLNALKETMEAMEWEETGDPKQAVYDKAAKIRDEAMEVEGI